MVKNPPANTGDVGSISGLGRSPGIVRGNPLQYSCLENTQGQRSLAGYSPWGHRESDTTEVTEDVHMHIYRKTHIALLYSSMSRCNQNLDQERELGPRVPTVSPVSHHPPTLQQLNPIQTFTGIV